jgi:hypothetical protein
MRRADLWSDARKRVEAVLRDCSPSDQVALFTFDRQINQLVSFDQWTASAPAERSGMLLGRLVQSSPGWGSTQLGNALVQAAEALADSGTKSIAPQGRIELITDLHEGSHLEQLQGYEWPKGVEVSVTVVKPRNVGNASIQWVSDGEEPEAKGSGSVRVRVANEQGSKREQFKVGWGRPQASGFADKPIDVYVPAGQSRIVSVPVSLAGQFDRILLQGDEEEFDNVVFVNPPDALRLHVVYVGADTELDHKQPLYFLKRAFQETRHQVVEVTAHRPSELIPAAEAQSACLFVVTAPLSEEAGEAIREKTVAGKTLLLIAGSSGIQGTFRRLLGVENLNLSEVRPGSYAMLGEIDFRHPIFAAFADPRFSDFTKIHFWKYTRLDPAAIPHAQVLARFDTGDPALIEVPVGTGRILVLTSSWQPDSSQLALSSKFVPLLYGILEGSGVPALASMQYRVGDLVPLPALGAEITAPVVVHLPDGSQTSVQVGGTNFAQTTTPGPYSLAVGNTVKNFVVNLDPVESRTAPLPTDELERLGVPAFKPVEVTGKEAIQKTRLQNADLENRQKLWRWFIAGTLLVLIFESWLAGRTARRVTIPSTMASG